MRYDVFIKTDDGKLEEYLSELNVLFSNQSYLDSFNLFISDEYGFDEDDDSSIIVGEFGIKKEFIKLADWNSVISTLIENLEYVTQVYIEKQDSEIKLESTSNDAIEIWGVSDLHLGPGQGKGHFSSKWVDHQSKLRSRWDKKIPENSLVLMPGDFSWNKNPKDLEYDYLWIDKRPGQKVMSPGNHDYGIWDNHQEAADFVKQFTSLNTLMNTAIRVDNPFGEDKPGIVIAAAQGTQSPSDYYFNTNAGASAIGKDNESVRFLNELVALDLAIEKAKELQQDGDDLVVMIHYPPFSNCDEETAFSKMIEKSGAKLCLYGHLHKKIQFRYAFQGKHNNCHYRFMGADFNRFTPVKIADFTTNGIEIGEVPINGAKEWPEESTMNYTPPKPKFAAERSILTNEILRCLECNHIIYTDEPHHLTPKGPIHGNALYGDYNTCKYAEDNKYRKDLEKKFGSPYFVNKDLHKKFQSLIKNEEIEKLVKHKFIRNKNDAENAQEKVMCYDCKKEITNNEPYHYVSKDKFSHGEGYFGQIKTCKKNSNSSSNSSNNSKNNSNNKDIKFINELYLEAYKQGKLPPQEITHTTDEEKTCIDCNHVIEKGQKYHQISEGTYCHGKGFVGQIETCWFKKKQDEESQNSNLEENQSNDSTKKQTFSQNKLFKDSVVTIKK